MRNFPDTLYACKRVSTCFNKSCSQIFLITMNKTKQILDPFVDIAKETACEKI